MKNPFRRLKKTATVVTNLRELEAELEAAGDPAGDRRTKEWDEAVRHVLEQESFNRGHQAGYKEGYQDGRADGQESQQLGNPVRTRNKYPNG